MSDNKNTNVVDAENTSTEQSVSSPQRNKYADKMNGKKKRIPGKVKAIIALLIAGAIGYGFYYWSTSVISSQEEMDEMMAQSFSSRGMLETSVSGWGTARAKDRAELGKNTVGVVTEVFFSSGEIVKTGDVIFTVDPIDARRELDDALTTLEEATTALSDAQKDVNNLKIVAPFDGKVIATGEGLKKGDSVSPSTSVATYVDDSKMLLELFFSYAYIDSLTTGLTAEVSVPASMSNVSGTVTSVEHVKKISADGTVLFKATIEIPNTGTLTKDMVATATITSPAGNIVPSEAGTLEYFREEEVTSKITGEIIELNASEYYEYQAGDVLATLENDSLYDTIKSAQRTLESAQDTVNDKQKAVDESIVTSPIDGIVAEMVVSVGDELTGSGTALAIVSNLEKVVVDINVDEMDISKVSAGLPVNLTIDSPEGGAFLMGTLSSVSFEATAAENGGIAYFPAVIEVENLDNTLMPGMGVQYHITTEMVPDAIIVPSAAIVYAEGGVSAVYAKPMDGVEFETILPSPEGSEIPEGFVLVQVETGIADNTNTEIVSGIPEGVEIFLASPVDPYANAMYMY